MTDNIENLVLEQLRGLRSQIEGVRTEITTLRTEMRSEFQDVKHRLGRLEIAITTSRRDNIGTQEDVYRQQAAMDRMNARIERIERRLELAD